MSTVSPTATDRYPSRVGPEPGITERKDPVVHGSVQDGPLTQEQLDYFERNGFMQLPGVLSPEECQEAIDEFWRFGRSPEMRGDDRTILEPDSDEVRSTFEIHRIHELGQRIVSDERLAGVARQLLGGEVYIHQSRVNFKPPFRGKEFYWHSDFETWHTEDGMPGMRAVSFSIALTDNYIFNGPLMIIPGSHKKYVVCVGETPEDHYKESLREQEIGTPDNDSLRRLVDEADGHIEVFTGGIGGVTIFDCNAMHGSNSNITPLPRSNLFFVYNSMENTLVEPFSAPKPRPEHIASRTFEPV